MFACHLHDYMRKHFWGSEQVTAVHATVQQWPSRKFSVFSSLEIQMVQSTHFYIIIPLLAATLDMSRIRNDKGNILPQRCDTGTQL